MAPKCKQIHPPNRFANNTNSITLCFTKFSFYLSNLANFPIYFLYFEFLAKIIDFFLVFVANSKQTEREIATEQANGKARTRLHYMHTIHKSHRE